MRSRAPSIARLRDRAALLRRDSSLQADGGYELSYTQFAEVWAEVRPSMGADRIHADARAARVSHQITLRYRDDLVPGDRIKVRGKDLDIVSAEDPNGRRAYLSCKCTEILVVG